MKARFANNGRARTKLDGLRCQKLNICVRCKGLDLEGWLRRNSVRMRDDRQG